MNDGRFHCQQDGCDTEEFLACSGFTPDLELSVLLDLRGIATNRWEDGIAGVSAELQAAATNHTQDCAPYCPIHRTEAVWRASQEAES